MMVMMMICLFLGNILSLLVLMMMMMMIMMMMMMICLFLGNILSLLVLTRKTMPFLDLLVPVGAVRLRQLRAHPHHGAAHQGPGETRARPGQVALGRGGLPIPLPLHTPRRVRTTG